MLTVANIVYLVQPMTVMLQFHSTKHALILQCHSCFCRCNMTLTAHPEKDILMMFGGEYFDGSRVCLKL